MKTKTERQEELLYWQYARESVLPVLRMIMIFGVVAQVIFMFEDWYATPDHFLDLFKAKLILIGVFIGGYLVSASKNGHKYVNISMLVVAISVIFNGSIQATLIGADFMVPLVAILITFISASLFPWQLRYHVLVTIICVTGVVLNMVAMKEPPYIPLTREAMSGVVFPAATILLAIFAHQRRYDLWLAQRAVKESEERFKQLAVNSPDIIWIWSPDRKIQYVSPAYTKYTGLEPEVLYGSPRKALLTVHKDDRPAFGKSLEDIMNGSERRMEWRVIHTDGTEYILEGWGTPIKDKHGNVTSCIGNWRDVTKRVKLAKELDLMATTDELTKAYNRRFFFDVAAKEVKRAVRKQLPFSLLMLDVDHFKKINDSSGHHVGDKVLKEISSICLGIVRGEDVFARFGGEEFAFLLPDTDCNDALRIAERVRTELADNIIVDKGKTISITVSIGVASWQSGKAIDINVLLSEADQAMYFSKSNGRNKVTLYIDESENVETRNT